MHFELANRLLSSNKRVHLPTHLKNTYIDNWWIYKLTSKYTTNTPHSSIWTSPGRGAYLLFCPKGCNEWNTCMKCELTSLKRFQCFILRLYCEIVDSHCSSSRKLPPVLSGSFPLRTAPWTPQHPAKTKSRTWRSIALLKPAICPVCVE